jgi:RNA 2',3'-cyclic 3'-phosphodiesterase
MRLFIASPLTSEIEQMLAEIIFNLKQNRGRVRWVDAKNIHLTLKFLGDTEENKVEAIKKAIKDVSSRHQKIDSVIDKVGVFPNINRPRVIWAGLSENIEQLKALADETEDAMAELGFEKEKRPFKSHLTLGRVKDDSGLYELKEAIKSYKIEPQPLIFDKIILFKSTLTPAGAIYDRLFEADLA